VTMPCPAVHSLSERMVGRVASDTSPEKALGKS
jgi:hypothetical protein